jgi:hypothetical protein
LLAIGNETQEALTDGFVAVSCNANDIFFQRLRTPAADQVPVHPWHGDVKD